MKAPHHPTVVAQNPNHDKYTIQFAPELTDFILKEGKTKTYRFGFKYDYLKNGDKVTLLEYGTNKFIADAIIMNKEVLLFKDIPLSVNDHEVYESKEHQKKYFRVIINISGERLRIMINF
jgi:hypothetical protein